MNTNDFQFLIYRSAEEDVSVQAVIRDETIWLTQKAMAELFGVSKQTISYHLNNIFSEGELLQETVVKEILTTATDGKSYPVEHYSLYMVLAVGYCEKC